MCVVGGGGLLVETRDSAAAHSEDLGLESTQSPRTFTGLRTGSQASSGCPLYSKGLRCRSGLDGGRTRNGQICVISNDSVRLGGNIQLSSLFRKGQVVQLRLTRVSIPSQSRDLKRAHGRRNAGNIASKWEGPLVNKVKFLWFNYSTLWLNIHVNPLTPRSGQQSHQQGFPASPGACVLLQYNDVQGEQTP